MYITDQTLQIAGKTLETDQRRGTPRSQEAIARPSVCDTGYLAHRPLTGPHGVVASYARSANITAKRYCLKRQSTSVNPASRSHPR